MFWCESLDSQRSRGTARQRVPVQGNHFDLGNPGLGMGISEWTANGYAISPDPSRRSPENLCRCSEPASDEEALWPSPKWGSWIHRDLSLTIASDGVLQ